MNKTQKFFTVVIFSIITTFSSLAQFSGGNGTQTFPYLISNKNDMEALADSVNNSSNWSKGKHFKLISDITDSITTVIGGLQGYFNGDNFKITVSIHRPISDVIGLFRVIDSSAVVENLNVDGRVVARGHNVAGITGHNRGLIKNCNNYASIKSERGYAAGIAGTNCGTVIHNKNYGTIDGGTEYFSVCVGGVVGHNNAFVSYSLNAGSVSSYGGTGGITGHNNGGYTSYSVNIGTVIAVGVTTNPTSRLASAGGIVGLSDGENGYTGYSINSGLVIGNDRVGGICGTTNPYPTVSWKNVVEHNINTGVVISISNEKIGAIVGEAGISILSNNFYDKQMCIYGGINGNDAMGKAEGRLTRELTGNNLLSKLGTTNWVYNNNLYPMLKGLEDEIISKIAASPAYLNATKTDFDRQNNVRDCFTVNLANNIEWTHAFNNLRIENNKVYLDNLGNDTLYAGIGNVKKTIPLTVNKLCKMRLSDSTTFERINFYIRASEHLLVDPTRRNYRIPIFIKADEYVSGSMIDSLVIEIDRRIFYPRRIDNGDMSLHFKDTVIKMTFENVIVPELKANEEKVLLTIRGDVLLGEIDSSEIKIDTVIFAEQLSEEPDLIQGFITLDICVEGANRLVWFDYSPEVIVKNNPVTGGILELQCKTIERGSYSLEIIDMLGKSETVREFTVSANGKRIFDFEIPISNFASGAYFIIMNTPSAKYSTKFVVQ